MPVADGEASRWPSSAIRRGADPSGTWPPLVGPGDPLDQTVHRVLPLAYQRERGRAEPLRHALDRAGLGPARWRAHEGPPVARGGRCRHRGRGHERRRRRWPRRGCPSPWLRGWRGGGSPCAPGRVARSNAPCATTTSGRSTNPTSSTASATPRAAAWARSSSARPSAPSWAPPMIRATASGTS